MRVFVGATHTALGTLALPFIDAIGVRGHQMYADTPVAAWVAQALAFTACALLSQVSRTVAAEGLSIDHNHELHHAHLVPRRVGRKIAVQCHKLTLWVAVGCLAVAILATLPYTVRLHLWGQYWATGWLGPACTVVYAMLLSLAGLRVGCWVIAKHRLVANSHGSAAAAMRAAWLATSKRGVACSLWLMRCVSFAAQATVVAYAWTTTRRSRGAGWMTDVHVLGVALLSLPLCFATSYVYLRVAIFGVEPDKPTLPPQARRIGGGRQWWPRDVAVPPCCAHTLR